MVICYTFDDQNDYLLFVCESSINAKVKTNATDTYYFYG